MRGATEASGPVLTNGSRLSTTVVDKLEVRLWHLYLPQTVSQVVKVAPENRKFEVGNSEELQIKFVHHGVGAVRPYIYGRLDLLDFVKNVFDAIELERNQMPTGFHVQAQIADSVMVLSAMDPPYPHATRASTYVYVEDVDATYQRALAQGATSINEPADKPWKGRNAAVKDAFGNIWYMETYKG